ncbi:Heavy metal transport/detoxification superfamily protein [Salvia divinorum]|uniref:Heavy metal transport/detoxification superfamily protein n=1 Tax=Salvia divinorum TaxID=28513 RepID=A0ABD1HVK7_SALDI
MRKLRVQDLLYLKDLIAPTPTLAFQLKPKMVVMKVSMHCNGCAKKVEKHISKLEAYLISNSNHFSEISRHFQSLLSPPVKKENHAAIIVAGVTVPDRRFSLLPQLRIPNSEKPPISLPLFSFRLASPASRHRRGRGRGPSSSASASSVVHVAPPLPVYLPSSTVVLASMSSDSGRALPRRSRRGPVMVRNRCCRVSPPMSDTRGALRRRCLIQCHHCTPRIASAPLPLTVRQRRTLDSIRSPVG